MTREACFTEFLVYFIVCSSGAKKAKAYDSSCHLIPYSFRLCQNEMMDKFIFETAYLLPLKCNQGACERSREINRPGNAVLDGKT